MGFLEQQRKNGPLPGGCYIDGNRLVNSWGELLAELEACPLCNHQSERNDRIVPPNLVGTAKGYECQTCGEFVIETSALGAGFHKRQQIGDHATLPLLSATIREVTEQRRQQKRKYTLTSSIPVPVLVNNLIGNPDPRPGFLGINELLAPPPLTRAERLDKALLNLFVMTEHDGHWVGLSPEDYSLGHAQNTDMFAFQIRQLQEKGLLRALPAQSQSEPLRVPQKVQLTGEGLTRAHALATNEANTSDADEMTIVSPNQETRRSLMAEERTLRIVVASPGDVQAERNSLVSVIEELNNGVAGVLGLRLQLSRWETDVYPGFNPTGPQGHIDSILRIQDCDILIGIFWKKFGTPVQDANSGTEHEFNVAHQAWQQTSLPHLMMYFNQKKYMPQSQPEVDQQARVLAFRHSISSEGVYATYDGPSKFAGLVRGL